MSCLSPRMMELSPELRDKGFVYYSPIVGLRQHFDLDICIRPCLSFKGNPLNFVRRGASGRGDLYVKLVATLPSGQQSALEEVAREMEALYAGQNPRTRLKGSG